MVTLDEQSVARVERSDTQVAISRVSLCSTRATEDGFRVAQGSWLFSLQRAT
ncbi:hypothetical protein [Phytopseudomonas dryadis]|uniref:hypothetical protein n=1 Tax=Phytopseudomonas dryadis TaxID=2487520 RepID=UPI001A954968|nr:hypothetical protein [Pseudomonas dryadis]